jgi:hypothetical protein
MRYPKFFLDFNEIRHSVLPFEVVGRVCAFLAQNVDSAFHLHTLAATEDCGVHAYSSEMPPKSKRHRCERANDGGHQGPVLANQSC